MAPRAAARRPAPPLQPPPEPARAALDNDDNDELPELEDVDDEDENFDEDAQALPDLQLLAESIREEHSLSIHYHFRTESTNGSHS